MQTFDSKESSELNNADAEASDLPIYQMVSVMHVTYGALFSVNFFGGLDKKIHQYSEDNDINELLCFGDGFVLQYAEGSEEALTNLKNKLLASSRYINFHLYDFSKIEERRFAETRAGFFTISNRQTKIHHNLVEFLPFRPLTWTINTQLDFFSTLINNRLISDRLRLTKLESALLRLMLFRKMGSGALTKQQILFSSGILFCVFVYGAMMYLILFT